MSNQASEVELKERIGNLHAYNFDGDDVTVKVMVDEDNLESIAKFVEAIIRTEKLKLLDEVRERVIGENASKGTYMTYSNLTPVMQDFRISICNDLKDDQRTALTKLEAEL